MITKFLTEIGVKFNPFAHQSKAARLFLTNLPSKARQSGIIIHSTVLPAASVEPSSVRIKYKDGKELSLQCDTMTIQDVIESVDRHSRALQKAATLSE